MSDGIHAAKHGMQPAQRQPVPDCPVTQADGLQLPARDDSVLASREHGYPALNSPSLSFGLYIGLNLSHV